MDLPTPIQLKAAREAAGLSQDEAARLVYIDRRSWQRWESRDRKINAAYWELFLIKTAPQNKSPYDMSIQELQVAIAPLQAALYYKMCGDPSKGIGLVV